ncbi:hypothetical protein R70211_01289 [Paraburkholderia domus]|uniref:Uncharacterized protein n=1 Tax=Paraburkholderia domus TaxID=2793075 RepID=A0A9N8QUJ9_9BURK|nr:hypothetical protein R70211_01289 [Paraburkholderia domus]
MAERDAPKWTTRHDKSVRKLDNSREGLGDLKNLGGMNAQTPRGVPRSSLKAERTLLFVLAPLSLLFAYSFIRLILWIVFR